MSVYDELCVHLVRLEARQRVLSLQAYEVRKLIDKVEADGESVLDECKNLDDALALAKKQPKRRVSFV